MNASLKIVENHTADGEGWMQTLSGGRFTPLKPQPEQIDIHDIAGSLSKMCRYGGHCLNFYSVAEHCVLVASKAAPEHQLTALMHDASEAYLSDVIRPLKPHLAGYYAFENELMSVISKKFGLIDPLPAEVRRLDQAILRDEREQNMEPMAVTSALWGDIFPPIGVELRCWMPKQAEIEFLNAFYRYGGVA